jgi:dienelactone hydrolase
MLTATKLQPPRYEPQGWMQWPDHPELSFQFLRSLGAAQKEAGTISECFLAASRIDPTDLETWHREWKKLGEVNEQRARDAEEVRHPHTAHANWMRAANYYRAAEFYLDGKDPRRMQLFDKVEACTHRCLALMDPPGERVTLEFGAGDKLYGYFVKPKGAGPWPTVVCFGGLDEYKDEQLHKLPRHAFARGMALLLVDLPGQGGTRRRGGVVARHDMEVPLARCVDYLQARSDVDKDRIAIYGSSLGGVYAARGGAFERRFKAVVSDSLVYDIPGHLARLAKQEPDGLVWIHLRFVFGADTVEGVLEKSQPFHMKESVSRLQVPYLVVQGAHDFLGVQTAIDAYEQARKSGVDATLKIFEAEETGASHCQVDNGTLGMEFICDWLADQLGIVQTR